MNDRANKGSETLAVLAVIVCIIFLWAGIHLEIKFHDIYPFVVSSAAFFVAFIFALNALRFFRQRNNEKYRDKNEPKDGRRVRKGFVSGVIGILMFAGFFGIIVFVWNSMAVYNCSTPKIQCEAEVVAHPGDTFCFDDLATYTCMKGQTVRTGFSSIWFEGEIMDASISEDKQMLTIGQDTGIILVEIFAMGIEPRAETIRIIVK